MARTVDVSEQLTREWNLWLEQRELRLQHGDDLRVERPIDHVMVFRWRSRALRAAKIISQSRTVTVSRSQGGPRWVLQATAPDDLKDESVRHSLEFMLTVAEWCRGQYDGFGAPVAG